MSKDLHWITQELPENYKEMIFFSLDISKYNLLFCKEQSNLNIINDPNTVTYKILKAIRDDSSYLKKISKIKYNLKTFKEAKSKNSFKSDTEEAINNYILYRLSKKHEGKVYQKFNKLNQDLIQLSEKIDKNTFIFNYSIKECLKLFNNEDVIIYYSPDLKQIKKPEHLEIINILLKQYSKVIINTYDNPIYKKHFKNWIKKKRPGQANKIKIECVWKNF